MRKLFRRATRDALRYDPPLYDPGVADHISEDILAEFVHVDRIFRIRNSGGVQIRDIAEMVLEGTASSGYEREMEVHQHVGDFALFMTGIFPESLERSRYGGPDPMVARVGSIMVSFRRPFDYYAAEGRNAYRRCADMWEGLSAEQTRIFTRLADGFEGYIGVMTLIRTQLQASPDFKRIEGLIL